MSAFQRADFRQTKGRTDIRFFSALIFNVPLYFLGGSERSLQNTMLLNRSGEFTFSNAKFHCGGIWKRLREAGSTPTDDEWLISALNLRSSGCLDHSWAHSSCNLPSAYENRIGVFFRRAWNCHIGNCDDLFWNSLAFWMLSTHMLSMFVLMTFQCYKWYRWRNSACSDQGYVLPIRLSMRSVDSNSDTD